MTTEETKIRVPLLEDEISALRRENEILKAAFDKLLTDALVITNSLNQLQQSVNNLALTARSITMDPVKFGEQVQRQQRQQQQQQ